MHNSDKVVQISLVSKLPRDFVEVCKYHEDPTKNEDVTLVTHFPIVGLWKPTETAATYKKKHTCNSGNNHKICHISKIFLKTTVQCISEFHKDQAKQ